MSTANPAVRPVLHSEWIKIRSVRSVLWSLLGIVPAAVAISVLAGATTGEGEADALGSDRLAGAFFGLNFGQIAAIAFGTTAVAGEYHQGALRLSLSAVPDRTRFFLGKITVIGALALLVGWVAGLVSFLAGQAFRGPAALGLGDQGVLRAVFGSGCYLALMALFAAGLTALLRSGGAVLGLLIPFVLIVSFVVGDTVGGVARYLPDRAGQAVLHQDTAGGLGPWSGLAVMALWAGAALVAGWLAVYRRDA
ncbi:ABC transporter permease subunit [Streptomyces sp. NPDC086023]|uniref:ABC transporter permease subunit n=1 Tax=Streptomyces sp. NPDC086023 TaxID=3365746 RepID=UPI0037CD7733